MSNAYRPPSSFGLFPPVVKNLLIINVLVFLAQYVFDARSAEYISAFQRWFALWPIGGPEAIQFRDGLVTFGTFQPWQLLTSAFMHAGVGHILFNLFGLWMFGGVVERTLGSKRFLWFYLACVLGASLLQVAVSSWPFLMGDGGIPGAVVGASGGVLGVLAAFGVLYPDQPIYLLFFPVPIPAKWFVLGYAVFSLYAGYAGTVQANVAHFAHLGGMITGALLILYWRGRLPVRPSTRLP